MEGKVDIQKLQVLCDRINQTVDVLAQVRMSVSGLAHTGTLAHRGTLAHTGALVPYGMGFHPTVGFVFPYQGLQNAPPLPLQSLQMPMVGLGLQHSVDPRLGTAYGTRVPIGYGEPFGIRHSGVDEMEKRVIEAQASDPYRLGRTFPFVFSGGPIGLW